MNKEIKVGLCLNEEDKRKTSGGSERGREGRGERGHEEFGFVSLEQKSEWPRRVELVRPRFRPRLDSGQGRAGQSSARKGRQRSRKERSCIANEKKKRLGHK